MIKQTWRHIHCIAKENRNEPAKGNACTTQIAHDLNNFGLTELVHREKLKKDFFALISNINILGLTKTQTRPNKNNEKTI